MLMVFRDGSMDQFLSSVECREQQRDSWEPQQYKLNLEDFAPLIENYISEVFH